MKPGDVVEHVNAPGVWLIERVNEDSMFCVPVCDQARAYVHLYGSRGIHLSTENLQFAADVAFDRLMRRAREDR